MTNTIREVTLAYFSGTGGTKAAVDCFKEQFDESGIKVNVVPVSSYHTYQGEKSDLLVICSPVYAFRLASIVEDWVKGLPEVQDAPAAIISVSGGGEVSPNTACRVHCGRLLKRKGYHVVYEKMLVMPSNFASKAEEQLNYSLINILPRKVERIVSDLLAGKRNITYPKFQDRIFAGIGKAEHFGARVFGTSIKVSKECNQCGLCVKNCPKQNITMKQGSPAFGFQCIWCLKCIYACPRKALSPGILKFSVLDNGYDLKEMSEKAQLQHQIEYSGSPNMLWQGVVDYLNEQT